jgi:hypothetical protein
MTTPPCAGKADLFDSTHWADHTKAATLCATCPLIEECRTKVKEAQKAALYPLQDVRGTWAGKLYGLTQAQQSRLKRRWDDREARAAKHERTDRTDPERVINAVAFHSRRRAADVRADHVTTWLLRHAAGLTYPQVGRITGRHHTTAMYAVKKVSKSPALLAQAREIAHLIGAPDHVVHNG